MHLSPIEIYLALLVVIPLGVCFAKWKFAIGWLSALLICAASSWLYFNLWMAKLDPPDNGFTNLVYFVSGWFWLLPLFGVFFIGFRLIEKRLSISTRLNVGARGFKVCANITILIVVWNFVGRMSAERAVIEAREELRERGYEPAGREIPEYKQGSWIVRYPDTDFGEIRLTRNGNMSWIGGPG